MRRPQQRSVRGGLIGLLVTAIAVYAIFTKSVPLREHFTVQAVFTDSNLLQEKNPVRIAGVEVGQVESVERYKDTDLALVTMRISDQGRPIHADATLKIRPRLFLEGNFFVDLQPGSPSAPVVDDGDLIGVSQTSAPVQLDNVLSALQTDTRRSLQRTLQGFGEALDGKPTAADDVGQDPSVHGLTGAQALNKALRTSPDALRGSAVVNTALAGRAPHDLSATIGGFARAARAAAANQRQLADLIGHFNTTMAATAGESRALTETIGELGPTAASARRGFASLLAALPPTREFARDLVPAVDETPAAIAAMLPWLDQARPLLSDAELGGLLDELAPATSDLARLGHETREFLPRIDAFNRCITEVFLPTGDIEVDDGPLSAGVESYKEFWYAMVGQAGEAQQFDGNGSFLRLAATGGEQTIQLGNAKLDGTAAQETGLFANPPLPPVATRPAFPNKQPPLRRDVPCHTQPVPDVNGPASVGPADGSRPGAPAPAVEDDPGVRMGRAARAAAAFAEALTGGGS